MIPLHRNGDWRNILEQPFMIRAAVREDISRIAEILVFGKRVAYRSYFEDDIGSFCDLQVSYIIEEYRENPGRLKEVVVYDDGIVKGMMRRKSLAEESDSLELCELYVEPFFQGEGIGQKLITFLIKEGEASHQKDIFLWVIEDNLPARRFYEKNGFIPDGIKRSVEGTKVTELRYRRSR